MLAVIYTLTMIGIALPFLTKAQSGEKVYRVNRDTSDARYAVNSRGYLEEIETSRVKGGYID